MVRVCSRAGLNSFAFIHDVLLAQRNHLHLLFLTCCPWQVSSHSVFRFKGPWASLKKTCKIQARNNMTIMWKRLNLHSSLQSFQHQPQIPFLHPVPPCFLPFYQYCYTGPGVPTLTLSVWFCCTERQAKVLIGVAWSLSFLFSIPTLIIFGKRQLSNGEVQCWALWPDDSYWIPYMTVVAFLVYFIPLIIIR